MNLSSVRVLFIEDSEQDAELAVRALQRDGLQVSWERVASEGALRHMLSAALPHVVLSDFTMPGFGGMHALEVVKEVAPDVPFIFVSGTIGEEYAIEAIRLGATDYVLKENLRRLGTAVKRAIVEAGERARARAGEEERQRLAAILAATSDLVKISDPHGRLIYMNAAGCELLGITEAKALQLSVNDIYPAWTVELIEREGRPVACEQGVWEGETALLRADGTEIPVSHVLIAHRGGDGGVQFFSAIARDIRERKEYEAQIRYFAHHDALTGLPNRRLLGDRATQAYAFARRSGRHVALLVFDLDRFQLVNDSYGHSAGDDLLRMVADRVRRAVREDDTVARLGADTFAVLATDLARADDAQIVARKIQACLQLPFTLGTQDVHLSTSVGASDFPRDGDDFETLLRNADAAVHAVKAAGRHGFRFYTSGMTHEATDRVQLENELRLALQNRDVRLHFQPQVELSDGRRIVGVEALMRWRHPQRGWISPAQFIPIAEDSDLIHRLGEFALQESCRQLREWDRDGLAPLRVAINVSARQFRKPGFVDDVSRCLRDSGLAPSRLEVELTEGVLVENRDEAVTFLKRLKALGVSVAVDDFGTGYSSLSYLSQLPIDCLKIDRIFVHRVDEQGHDAVIAHAIISLAHSLGLRVVAEGIETTAQLEALRSYGCEEGQGYLFARPVAAHELASLLAGGRRPPPRGNDPARG